MQFRYWGANNCGYKCMSPYFMYYHTYTYKDLIARNQRDKKIALVNLT